MASGTKKRGSRGRTTEKQGTHATVVAKSNRKGSTNRCWKGYEPVPGKAAHAKGSCRKAPKGTNGSKGR